jgi:hypothetical protein
MGFQEYTAFTILVPCILSMWPSQLSLSARMKFIKFLHFIISSSYWLVRRTDYPNLFCYTTLHVSGIFFAHHQECSTVHSALVSFMQVLMTASKQSHQNQHETYHCRMYCGKPLMMGKEDARNM